MTHKPRILLRHLQSVVRHVRSLRPPPTLFQLTIGLQDSLATMEVGILCLGTQLTRRKRVRTQ
jgi:hypothetical protein